MKQCRSGTSYKVIHATEVPFNYAIDPLQVASGSRETPKNDPGTFGPSDSRRLQQGRHVSCIKFIRWPYVCPLHHIHSNSI